MQTLSGRQAVTWFMFFLIGSSFLVLPSLLAVASRQDAWLAVLLAAAVQLLLLPLYYAIGKQMKGASFVGYVESILGRRAGRLAAAGAILFYPYLSMALTLRNLGDFVATDVLEYTPPHVTYAVMLAAVICAVRGGLSVCGRTFETLLGVAVPLLLLVFFGLVPNAKPENLLPILEFGWKPVVRGAYPLFAFPYLETAFFVFFVPHMDFGVWKRTLLRSILLSGGIYFLMVLLSVAVLGAGVVTRLTFPVYFVLRTFAIGAVFGRFEVLVSVLWYIFIFARLSLMLFIAVYGLGEVLRLSSPQVLAIPLSLVAFLAAERIWPNTTYNLELLPVWSAYAFALGFLFPLLLWLAGRLRERKGRETA